MLKIKCPHCGANNQDVTEKDRCWQCDAILGAPVSSAVAEPSAPEPAAVQKQIDTVKPTPVAPASQGRFPIAPVAIAVTLLLIALAIVLLIKR